MRAISAKASASCSLSPALFWLIVACLILDEATSSVDTRTEERIQATMDNLMRGRVVCHRSSLVDHSQCRFNSRFAKGDIVEQRTHAELLAANGAYANSITSQFAE